MSSVSYLHGLWHESSRRVFARLLSTLICSTLIVVRPVSQYGGSDAFLAFTIQELGFSIQSNIAQQVEASILNLIGSYFAIAVASLAHLLASLAGEQSIPSRTILACALLLFTFMAGVVKSRLPRLAGSMRVSCFIAVWMLTDSIDRSSIPTLVTNYVWITSAAALSTLASAIILLRQPHPQYAKELAAALAEIHFCLSCNFSRWINNDSSASDINDLQKRILKRSIALTAAYRQRAFEMRIGHVPIKQLKPLLLIVELLRRNLAWGMPPTKILSLASSIDPAASESFQNPSLELGSIILVAISVIERTILTIYESIARHDLSAATRTLSNVQERLEESLSHAELQLKQTCDHLEHRDRDVDNGTGVSQQDLDACLIMISLLRMARNILHALFVVQDLITSYDKSHRQLMLPVLTWAWLGVPAGGISLEHRGDVVTDALDVPISPTTLSDQETIEGIYETKNPDSNSYTESHVLDHKTQSPALYILRKLHLPHIWNHFRVLRARLLISRIIRCMRHSAHLQHGIKTGAGVIILAFPAFMPYDSPGHLWFAMAKGQWMVTSFVWVLETNTGATYRVAYMRLSGTILGALYAYIAWLACRSNPYGLVAAAVIANIPISLCILYTDFPSLGVVAYITLPPILFGQYYYSTLSTPHLAVLRGLMICAGILAAVIMNSLVFPRHCRVMFLNNTSRAIGLLEELYLSISRDLMIYQQRTRNMSEILKLELNIKITLHRMLTVIVTMNDELSLVPKPMRKYQKVVSVLQTLLDLMSGLHEIRETIPRKETVLPLVEQRREFMSCICISLFASEHVFKSRKPLPRFLPSARHAYQVLEKHMKLRVLQSRRGESAHSTLGLPLVYALAEMDLLNDMVHCVEELLELCRNLFGTSELCTSPADFSVTMSEREEKGHSLWEVV